MAGIRCANGCRDKYGKPFIVAQVDVKAEGVDAWYGKCRRTTYWRRKAAVAV